MTLALLSGIGLFLLVIRKDSSSTTPLGELQTVPTVATASTESPISEPTSKSNITAPDADDTHFETTTRFQFPALIAELEQMPDGPTKDKRMIDALKKWAALDGAAASTWAKQGGDRRRFLPDILQAWAGVDPESALSAWEFAKAVLATDGDTAAWLAPGFVKSAFAGMAAIPSDGWWNELPGLTGTPLAQAMFGAADFASNRQVNTDFSAAMEDRVLNAESPLLAAAFYAASGHITAAKSQLLEVADEDQWHTVAREVARQQAEYEPKQSMEWLQSQFAQPSDAIPDMVEGIGLTQPLNAQDVLTWLGTLPDSETRSAAMKKILETFPQLR